MRRRPSSSPFNVKVGTSKSMTELPEAEMVFYDWSKTEPIKMSPLNEFLLALRYCCANTAPREWPAS